MMGTGAKAGVTLLWAGALMAALAGPVLAQNKELSDDSVQALMRYAWGMVPEKFTNPQGKTIVVDKSKPKDVIVPVESASEIIRVGRMSALAQRCALLEEQRANYLTLMRREQAKSKWSEQQLIYIHTLHLMTVMLMSGNVQIVEKDGDKKPVPLEGSKPAKTESCTDTERKKIQDQVMAYVNAAPGEAPAAAASAAPVPQQPAKRAEPTPTSQKK
jgi:hypothetical protein